MSTSQSTCGRSTRTAASQTSFTDSESDVRDSERTAYVSGTRGQSTCGRLHRLVLRIPKDPFTDFCFSWESFRSEVSTSQRTLELETSFTDSESDVRDSECVRGGPLQGDFWSRIRLWKITGSRCQPARGPVGGERRERLLHRLVLRIPKATLEILRAGYCLPARASVGGHRTAASQTSFTESESDVRDSAGVRGGPLQGDFWSRIKLWKAVAKGITGSRCQPARGPVGGERTVYQPEHLWEVTERRLHRLVLRIPKATLEILRAYGENPFRAIFGLELDCGKLWRRASLGAGVNQPEDPWEVRERLIVYQPEHLWEVTERLLHRLVLRIPKATLEILSAYGEDPFRAIFGLELDCGKLWRGGITVVCVCTVVCVRLPCCMLIAATSIPINLPPSPLSCASALLYPNSCYLHSYKFATVTAVVYVCTLVC